MGKGSKIEWTDDTHSTLYGCSRVSSACEKCYAERIAHRFGGSREAWRGLTVLGAGGKGPRWTGEVREVDGAYHKPLRWRGPRRVFLNSMSDTFHPAAPPGALAKTFAMMAATPHVTWQVLTKRPSRAAEALNNENFVAGVRAAHFRLFGEAPGLGVEQFPWPLPNVWVGCTVEEAKVVQRLHALRDVPAAVRFVSAEPLLDDLPGADLSGVDWLIAGCESGPGARPMKVEWAEAVIEKARAAGAAVFVKQISKPGGKGATGDLDDFPPSLRIREFPTPKLTLAQAEAWSRAQDAAGKGAGARARAMFGGGL